MVEVLGVTASLGPASSRAARAGLLLLLALAGCAEPQTPPTRVDIYADGIEYRMKRYPSATALAVGMKAARAEPNVVELHACDRRAELEAVLDVVRARGVYNVAVVLPENC